MDKNEVKIAKYKLLFVYFMFGTIGLFAKFVPLASQVLVFYRCFIGALFIYIVFCLKKNKFNINIIKENIKILLFAGLSLGIYWMFQFLALDYIPLSIATVCYNMEPIVLLIISIFMFNEKITLKIVLCIIMSMCGIFLISGAITGHLDKNSFLGIVFGLLTAIFYAFNVAITKKLKNITSYEKSIIQFLIGGLLMLPIIFINKMSFTFPPADNYIVSILSLLIICIIDTGLIYILFFDAVTKAPSSVIAVYAYLDPVVSIVLAYIILGERLDIYQWIGVILILVAVMINEFVGNKKI